MKVQFVPFWNILPLTARFTKRRPGVSVDIYDGHITKQLRQDIEVHNSQYPGVTLHYCPRVHDRFLIIDDTTYHIGASLKDLGKKIFAFSKFDTVPANGLIKIIAGK